MVVSMSVECRPATHKDKEKYLLECIMHAHLYSNNYYRNISKQLLNIAKCSGDTNKVTFSYHISFDFNIVQETKTKYIEYKLDSTKVSIPNYTNFYSSDKFRVLMFSLVQQMLQLLIH